MNCIFKILGHLISAEKTVSYLNAKINLWIYKHTTVLFYNIANMFKHLKAAT